MLQANSTTQVPQTTEKPSTTKPTKRRRFQTQTDCEGLYCDEKFWDITNSTELKRLESEQGNWEDYNRETEAGDYLPNEFDQTCGLTTKTSFIVGGEDTKIGEFPFIAALGMFGVL